MKVTGQTGWTKNISFQALVKHLVEFLFKHCGFKCMCYIQICCVFLNIIWTRGIFGLFLLLNRNSYYCPVVDATTLAQIPNI